jgi:hypothetical protein
VPIFLDNFLLPPSISCVSRPRGHGPRDFGAGRASRAAAAPHGSTDRLQRAVPPTDAGSLSPLRSRWPPAHLQSPVVCPRIPPEAASCSRRESMPRPRGWGQWDGAGHMRLLVITGVFSCVLPHLSHDAASPWTRASRTTTEAGRMPSLLRGGAVDEDAAPARGQMTRGSVRVVDAAAVRLEAADQAVSALQEPALAEPRHWPPGARAPAARRPDNGHLHPAPVSPYNGPIGPAQLAWQAGPTQLRGLHVEQSEADFLWNMQRQAYVAKDVSRGAHGGTGPGGLYAHTPPRPSALGGHGPAYAGGAGESFGTVRVMLPRGVTPGQRLPVSIPGRPTLLVTVPEGALGGQYMDVMLAPQQGGGGGPGRGPQPYRPCPPRGGQEMSGAGASAGARPVERGGEHLVKNDLRSVSIILPEKCVAGQQLQVLECATPSICLPQMRNAVYLPASNMHAAACETRTSSVCGLS